MSKDNKRLSKVMIVGGIFILFITAGGAFLSQNPQIIEKWQYQRDSERQDQMRKILLKAPASCKGQKVGRFAAACVHLDDAAAWYSQLSSAEQSCFKESFVITNEFKLAYDGDPLSNLENYTNEDEITLHACGVSEDSKFYLKDKLSSDAQEFLNHWYQWKFDEGNYFN